MQKRTLTKTICCLLVLAICIGCMATLASCSLIQKNDAREAEQVLATIQGADGKEYYVTQSDVMEYYSTYGGYATNSTYYSYFGLEAPLTTVEEVFDWCLENKIKSKYLISEAAKYLSENGRKSTVAESDFTVDTKLLKKKSAGENYYKSLLTYAEYFAAIKSVNDSIDSTIDSYIDSIIQDRYETAYKAIDKDNVKEIVFAEDTLSYLKEEYYTGSSIDTSKVKIQYVYNDGEKSEAFIVPEDYYTTAFSAEDAATDSTFVIEVERNVEEDSDDESVVTLTWTFDVVAPRATRTEQDNTSYTAVALGDDYIDRYASKTDIEKLASDKGYKITKLDPTEIYNNLKNQANANTDEVEAYRKLIEAMDNNGKTMEALYKSAIESAVLSAATFEVKHVAYDAFNALSDSEKEEKVINEFKYLFENQSQDYLNGADKQDTFYADIKDGISALYYYPAFESIDLSEYFYVYQVLLSFSDEQKAFLEANIGTNEEANTTLYENAKNQIEVKESNLNYDADFDCPVHEQGLDGTCTYKGEGTCPSCPYILDENGKAKTWTYEQVVTALTNDLAAIYDENIDATEKSEKAIEKFLEYVYRFNDDSGIMNTDLGYCISPDGQEDVNGSFDEKFLALARSVYDYGKGEGLINGQAFTGEDKLGEQVSSFGVYIVMITSTPFQANGIESIIGDKNATINYLNTVVDVNGNTLGNNILLGLNNDAQTLAYSEFTSKVPDNLKDNKDIVKIKTNKFDKMVEEYQGN